MPRRRRSFSRRQLARKWVWARSMGTGLVVAPDPGAGLFGGFTTDLLEDFKAGYGADPVGVTISRIRGQILYSPGPIASQVTQNAVVAARIATEPFGPNEEVPHQVPHADWFMWYPTLSTTHADDTPVNGNVYQQRFDVDVKANRKLEELAQGLVLAASHDTIGVAGEFTWNLSIGLKLP